MANPFTPKQWDATISDDDGEEFTVTLREMTGADELEIERKADESEADAGLLKVSRSCVSWSRPEELTPDTMLALRSSLWKQIVRAVQSGPPTQQDTGPATTAPAGAADDAPAA